MENRLIKAENRLQELREKIDVIYTTAKLLGYTAKKSGSITVVYATSDSKFPLLEISAYNSSYNPAMTILKTKRINESPVHLVTASHENKLNHLADILQTL